MKVILTFSLSLLLCFVLSYGSVAQPPKELIRVIVAPDHDNWEYAVGENAKFTITVLQYGNPVKGIELNYEIKPEKTKTGKEGVVILEKGVLTLDGGTMLKPGFLRCTASVTVGGITYSDFATAGFSVDKIKPTTTLTGDFVEFWENAKKDLAKIPVEATATLIPDRCTDKVDVYHISVKNINGSIYGILCKPKRAGKYPAILHVPGAGIRPYSGDISNAEKGIITLEIGIHGIPVNLDPQVYEDLFNGALRNYWMSNIDDKDEYYYKRVYLGCIRAVDFIFSLPEFDGENIAVAGGSQGGALSIVIASLDSRIKCLVVYFPAFCDLTGYLEGRAGGWPHMFEDEFTNKKEKVEVSKYYDVVNFARFVKVPGFYSWGFNDDVCPPTSVFSAYNVIESPKEKHLFLDSRHWTYPEETELGNNWLLEKLKK